MKRERRLLPLLRVLGPADVDDGAGEPDERLLGAEGPALLASLPRRVALVRALVRVLVLVRGLTRSLLVVVDEGEGGEEGAVAAAAGPGADSAAGRSWAAALDVDEDWFSGSDGDDDEGWFCMPG